MSLEHLQNVYNHRRLSLDYPDLTPEQRGLDREMRANRGLFGAYTEPTATPRPCERLTGLCESCHGTCRECVIIATCVEPGEPERL
jgi:hypothetical protein